MNTMQRIFPKKLKINDTIGLVSIAGAIETPDEIQNAKNYFSNLGFKVKVSNNVTSKNRYICGSDEERAKALNTFFADEKIDAIIAIRGGYGSIRILDKIDYNAIKKNPKIFGGYSDITALSLMIYKKTGLITFNTPMALSDFSKEINTKNEISFLETLQKGVKYLELSNGKVYKNGKAKGIIWGGNLSTIQSLCGLDFIPNEDFIFVTEDINEPVYKLDKIFTQLFNIEKFRKNIKGIVLGDFSNIDNKDYFDELINETAQKHNIVTTTGLKFGHEIEKKTFPIGVKSMLDTKNKTIELCEEFLK